ncbi:hypothetical protein Q3Y53_13045, partial [Synechococcus sp. YX-04-1]|uniref:hypothetical protein n=1 Tax=Synechococcus sp. YX-04-1 TaxID=3062778 RepID=UPI0026E419F8
VEITALSYAWRVLDDNGNIVAESTLAQFEFISQDSGTFTAVLTVTDAGGLSATAATSIEVTNISPQILSASLPGSRRIGDRVEYTVSIRDWQDDDVRVTLITADGREILGIAGSTSMPDANGQQVTEYLIGFIWNGVSLRGATIIATDEDGASSTYSFIRSTGLSMPRDPSRPPPPVREFSHMSVGIQEEPLWTFSRQDTQGVASVWSEDHGGDGWNWIATSSETQVMSNSSLLYAYEKRL